MKTPLYQKDLSLQSPILLDRSYKQAKIDKMLSILEHASIANIGIKKDIAIDIGCSAGFFTTSLTPFFTHVVGVDIDTHALKLADSESADSGANYVVTDSLNLPFEDRTVDLIICNHVYEHVPNADKLFEEIFRVLKPHGSCYLGAASRLTFIEPHYHLPLLSWLPKPFAHIYMRIMQKGDYYYENLRTYFGIKRLVSEFDITDYTLKVVADPDRYNARDLITKNSLLDKIPLSMWKAFYWLLPSYILILKRPKL